MMGKAGAKTASDDDFLDDILDDFAPSVTATATSTSASKQQPPSTSSTSSTQIDADFEAQLALGMEKLLADFAKASGNSADDSDNVPSADEVKQTMAALMGAFDAKPASKPDSLASTSKKQHTDKKHDFHAAINDTLENLKDSKVKVETELNNSQQQEPGSEDMEAMMKELEEMMGSAEFEDMFGSVMGQLMSRDLLYEPMKDLATKYPEYLQENKSNIPKADYERYKAQHLIVVDIMKVYDDESVTGDEEQKRVGDLMQKMQELGNPPEGIMKELTPGMEVGPDGLPKFPMPGMPGGNVPDCCIM